MQCTVCKYCILNAVSFFISQWVFKHVSCVCVVYVVCSVSVCVERRSLNESRLSCVCHRWLLTSSPLLWADGGGPQAKEGEPPAAATSLAAPGPGRAPTRAPCFPRPAGPQTQGCLPSTPANQSSSTAHLPGPGADSCTHTQTGLLLILCVFHYNEAWNEQ